MNRSRILRVACLLLTVPFLLVGLCACNSGEGSVVKSVEKVKNTYVYRKDPSIVIALDKQDDRAGVTAGNHRVEFVLNDKGEYILTTYIKKAGQWTAFYDAGEAIIQGDHFGAHPTAVEVVEDSAEYKALKFTGTHPTEGYAFEMLVEVYEGNPLIHFLMTNHLTQDIKLGSNEPRIMLWREGTASDLVYTNQEVPTYQTIDDTSVWCSGFPASYTYTDGMASAFYLDVTDMTWFSGQGVRRFGDVQVRTTVEDTRVGTGMDIRKDCKGDSLVKCDMVVDFYLYGEEVTEPPTKQDGLNTEVEVFANCLANSAVSVTNYVDGTVSYQLYMDKIVEGLMEENLSYQVKAIDGGEWTDAPMFPERTLTQLIQRSGYVPDTGPSYASEHNAVDFFGDWNCNNNTILPLVLYNRLNSNNTAVSNYLSLAKPGLLTYFDRMASLFRSFTGQNGSGQEFTFQNFLMQQGTLWASHFTPFSAFDPAYGGKFIQSAYGMQTLAHNVDYKMPQLVDVGRMGASSSIDEKDLGVTWEVWSGGFYAYNMMLAYDVTGNEMYLEEAEKQLDVLFSGLEYYANSLKQKLLDNTYEYAINEVSSAPWGIAAAQWLYRITGEEKYLSYSEDIRNITLRMMTWYESAVSESAADQALRGLSFFSAFSRVWTTCPWESIQTYLPMMMELKNTKQQASQVLLKSFNLFRINVFSFSGASWDPEVISTAEQYQSKATAYFMPEDYFCFESQAMPGYRGANNYMTNTLMYAYLMYDAYAAADDAEMMVINVDMCDEAREMAEGAKRHFVVFNPLGEEREFDVTFKDLDEDAQYTLTMLDEQGKELSKTTLSGDELMDGQEFTLDSMTYVHAIVELADEAAMTAFENAKTAQNKLMQAYAALQTAGEYGAPEALTTQKTAYEAALKQYQAGEYTACTAAIDSLIPTIPVYD